MKLITAGFGEHFDAAVTDFVKLGRERILVDANFTNRFFGRQLPGGEAVNVKLAAVGPGGWSSECLQVGEQFVGIIR